MFTIVSTCKGGGYRYARTEPLHPKANAKGLYPLHRVLMENKLGRLLRPGEVVHHRDENKENDDPDNLEVVTNADHSRGHQAVDEVETTCRSCGKVFKVKPYVLRRRSRLTKDGRLSCSRSCAGRILGGSTP